MADDFLAGLGRVVPGDPRGRGDFMAIPHDHPDLAEFLEAKTMVMGDTHGGVKLPEGVEFITMNGDVIDMPGPTRPGRTMTHQVMDMGRTSPGRMPR